MILRLCAAMTALLAPVAALASQPPGADDPEFAIPPFAGAYEPQGVDERGLWMQIDEAERTFRDSAYVLRDRELTRYVQTVLCLTVGHDRCSAARVYLVKDRSFNAGMYPNGMMLVHTGLLARVHSEAELATVLGHEFAHFELRHGVAGFRKQRSVTDAMAWISLLGVAAGQNTSATQNMLIGSYFAFSREQETQADLLAAAYIRSSGYSLHASDVWKRLVEENDALRKERKVRRIKKYRPGFADSHPTDLQRIEYFEHLEARDDFSHGVDHADTYRKETERVLPELFDSLVKGNEFAAADYVIRSRGDRLGWDGLILYERAELYRLRGNPRDIVAAQAFYQKATALPDVPPEAWRGLGLTSMRLGDSTAGRAALRRYLELAPDASDASAIGLLLEN